MPQARFLTHNDRAYRREKVVEAARRGERAVEIARRHGLSRYWVHQIISAARRSDGAA